MFADQYLGKHKGGLLRRIRKTVTKVIPKPLKPIARIVGKVAMLPTQIAVAPETLIKGKLGAKLVGVHTGMITGGFLKPGVLGYKGGQAKAFTSGSQIGRTIDIGAGVIGAGVVAAPLLAPATALPGAGTLTALAPAAEALAPMAPGLLPGGGGGGDMGPPGLQPEAPPGAPLDIGSTLAGISPATLFTIGAGVIAIFFFGGKKRGRA